MFAAIVLVLLFIRTLSASIEKANTNPTSSTSTEEGRAVQKDDDPSYKDAEALTSCEGAGGRCHPCPHYLGHIHHICRDHTSHSQAQHAYRVKNEHKETEAHDGHKSWGKSFNESSEAAIHNSAGQETPSTHDTASLQSSEHESSSPDTSDAYSIDRATNKSSRSTPPSTPSPVLPKGCMISKLPATMNLPFRPAISSSSNSGTESIGRIKSREWHRARAERIRNAHISKKLREQVRDTESPVKASIQDQADMEREGPKKQAVDQDSQLQDILNRFSKLTISARVLYSPIPAVSKPLPSPANVVAKLSPSPALMPVPETVEQADIAQESSPSPVLITGPETVEPTVEPTGAVAKFSLSPVLVPATETVEAADVARESSPSQVFISAPEIVEPAEAGPELSQSPALISAPKAVELAEAPNQLSEPAIVPGSSGQTQPIASAGSTARSDVVATSAHDVELSSRQEKSDEDFGSNAVDSTKRDLAGEDIFVNDAPASFPSMDEYDPNRPQLGLLQDRSKRGLPTFQRTCGSQSAAKARQLFAAAFPAGYETVWTSPFEELCGLNAIIKSIEANHPFIPLPTLEVLVQILCSAEFAQWQQSGFMQHNFKNLHVDQVGAVLHFWAATNHRLNLQVGVKIKGKEPILVPCGSDSQHKRHVVWIYNNNAEEEFRDLPHLAVLGHFSGMKPKAFPVNDTPMVGTEYKSREDAQDTEAVPGLNGLSDRESLDVPVNDTEMASIEDIQRGETSMEDIRDTEAVPVLNDFSGMPLPDMVVNNTQTVTAEDFAQLEAFMEDEQYTDAGAFLDQYLNTNSNGLPLGDAEMINAEDRQLIEAPMEDEQDRPEALGRPDSLMDDEVCPLLTVDPCQLQRLSSPQSSAVSGQLRSTQPQSISENITDAVMDDGYGFESSAGSYVPPDPPNQALQAILANLRSMLPATVTTNEPHLSTNSEVGNDSAIVSSTSLTMVDPRLFTESANVGCTITDTAASDRPDTSTNNEVGDESAIESYTSLATIDPQFVTESANRINTNLATPPADASQTSLSNESPGAQVVVATDLESVLQRLDPAAAADLLASLNIPPRQAERVIRQPRSVLARGVGRLPNTEPRIFPSNTAATNPPPEVTNDFVAGLQHESNNINFISPTEAGRIHFGDSQQQPQSSLLTPPDSPDKQASSSPDQPSKPLTKGPKPTAKDRLRAAGRVPQTPVTDNVPLPNTPSTDSQTTQDLDNSADTNFHAAPAIFVPSDTTTHHIGCPTEEEIYNAIHPRMGRRQVDLTLVNFRDRVNAHNRRLFRQRVKKVSWYTPCEQDPNEIVLYRDLEWKKAQQVSSLSPPSAVKVPPPAAQSAPHQQQQMMIPGLSLLGSAEGEEEVVGDIADDEILKAKQTDMENEQIGRLLAMRMAEDPEKYEESDGEGVRARAMSSGRMCIPRWGWRDSWRGVRRDRIEGMMRRRRAVGEGVVR